MPSQKLSAHPSFSSNWTTKARTNWNQLSCQCSRGRNSSSPPLKKDGGLDRLREWPPELAKKAVALLLEFHHVFSLEPNEIGCTDTTKHVIELMKDEPFKERFRHISPPLVDEVHQHIQEMLDGGAI